MTFELGFDKILIVFASSSLISYFQTFRILRFNGLIMQYLSICRHLTKKNILLVDLAFLVVKFA